MYRCNSMKQPIITLTLPAHICGLSTDSLQHHFHRCQELGFEWKSVTLISFEFGLKLFEFGFKTLEFGLKMLSLV